MDAEPLLTERLALDEDSFVELVVWKLGRPVGGCTHHLKYRLACVVHGVCVVRFDNEAGKGEHRHVGGHEMPYVFQSLDKLQVDFWSEVSAWEKSK
jgi:hypothetical protein